MFTRALVALTLVATTAEVGDSASYTVEYDDSTKALVTAGPYTLTILASGSLPAAGGLVIGLLAGMLVAFGALQLHRSLTALGK